MDRLTHLGKTGRASMVDISQKPDTERMAVAQGQITMSPKTLELVCQGALKKGDVLTIARIAGIAAAKRTSELIPLCHPIPVTHIEVNISLDQEASCIVIEAQVRTTGKTGAEMEALTAVSVAALTIYDMAKSVDHRMCIETIRLTEKHGGQSGDMIVK